MHYHSSKVKSSSLPPSGRPKHGRNGRKVRHADVESARIIQRENDKDNDIGLPRLIARIWGLVSGISYVSNGGYLLVQETTNKCQGAGAYMIMAGLVMIILECGCCIFQNKNNCCDSFEKKFPYWARGLIYVLSVIPALALCFGTKTLITSLIVITLALIYIFLTCLVRSKRYERLRGAARARYETAKRDTKMSYNAVSGLNSTINYVKLNATKAKNQHYHHHSQGKPMRSKKHQKARANTFA